MPCSTSVTLTLSWRYGLKRWNVEKSNLLHLKYPEKKVNNCQVSVESFHSFEGHLTSEINNFHTITVPQPCCVINKPLSQSNSMETHQGRINSIFLSLDMTFSHL